MGKFLLAGVLLALSGQAAAVETAIGNAPVGNISAFGFPDSQTYGQVFTAPVSDVMTSFTLRLGSGVAANMVGVLGTWNGPAGYSPGFGSPTTLYTSGLVPTAGGGSFTFTPNVAVTQGTRYVAYITLVGQTGTGITTMPKGDNSDPWLNYFVWNNETDPKNNPSWDYFLNFGDAHFDATFGDAVPEPQSWVMLIAGFGLVGAAARRRRQAAA